MVRAYFYAKWNGQESDFLKGAAKGMIEDGAMNMLFGDPSEIAKSISKRMLSSKPTMNYLHGRSGDGSGVASSNSDTKNTGHPIINT